MALMVTAFPLSVNGQVEASGLSFGTQVGEYNGVTAYSNYEIDYVSDEYNYVDAYNTGMKWQCVEYVNRYYYIVYGMEIRIPGTNAEDYYDTASDRGLVAYPNGDTTSPQPGDVLCSNGGTLGHVAIVREVEGDSLHVIHQNWANTEADNDKTISMSVSDGHYTVSGFSGSYPVQGWLRKPTEAIYVPDDYAKIQWAVDNATAGDTIIVRDEIYVENVNLNKRLTIQSENGSATTIVQAANPNDHVFEVTADYVNISGFTVKGTIGCRKAGIYLHNVNNCSILDDIASNNDYGIYLHYSSNNTLTNNTMSENDYNFGVSGYSLSNYIQNIDITNKVDGKPIYYWINEQNKQIPNNAGYVGVVNSTNITVRDLTLTNNQGVLFAYTENSTIENVTTSFPCDFGISLRFSNKNNVSNNNILWTGNGIYLSDSSDNLISNNSVSKGGIGLYLGSSSNNTLIENNMSGNACNFGVNGYSFDHFSQIIDTTNLVNGKPIYYLVNKHNVVLNSSSNAGYVGIINSSNVTVKDLTLTRNLQGVLFAYVDNSRIENVNATNNIDGISLRDSSNNIIRNNNASNNWDGIRLDDSFNNNIHLNNFMDNLYNVESRDSTNIWNSTEKITYNYNGTEYTNYLGNYWSDYKEKYPDAEEIDETGIWNTPYSINSDNDTYPLVEPFENYPTPSENIFDTGSPSNPYPSIMGNHTGIIKPNHTVIATKLYTYPCAGTGGHTEYARIGNKTWNATATWEGYAGDWHNISFDKTVVLLAGETYNYTIRTGSYPQIIHESPFNATGGEITCTKFTDANGKVYYDWIPAIRLE